MISREIPLFALSLVLWTGPATAKEIFEVENPFVSTTAYNNLLKCEPKFGQVKHSDLARIRRISFEIFDGNPGEVVIQRTTVFRPGEVSRAALQAKVSANNHSDKCGFQNVNVQSFNVTRTNVSADISLAGRVRVCKWYSNATVFAYSGNQTGGLTLNPDLSIAQQTRGGQIHMHKGKFAKALGLLKSVVTLPISVFNSWGGLFSGLTSKVGVGGLNTVQPVYAADTSQRMSEILKFQRLYGKKDGTPPYDFQTFPDQSGFSLADDGEVELSVVEHNNVMPYEKRIYRNKMKADVEFLDGLDEPDIDRYTVKKGDSFWRIAKSELGSGYYHVALRSLNESKGSKLRPGAQIDVPQPHAICEKALHDDLVRRGDTAWNLRRSKAPTKLPEKWISGKSSLIYPLENLVPRSVGPKSSS